MDYIGVDIIEIARIRQAIARWGTLFLERIYTEQELQLYHDQVPSLAARFAGKEAIIKALGTRNDRGFRWKDIEILSEPSGKPAVRLHGKARRKTTRLGLGNFAISLSHSHEYAIAMVAGKSKRISKPTEVGPDESP